MLCNWDHDHRVICHLHHGVHTNHSAELHSVICYLKYLINGKIQNLSVSDVYINLKGEYWIDWELFWVMSWNPKAWLQQLTPWYNCSLQDIVFSTYSEGFHKLQVKENKLCSYPEEVSQHEVVQKCWKDSTDDVWQWNSAFQWCCNKWQIEPKKCSAGVDEHLSMKTRTQFPGGTEWQLFLWELWVYLKEGELRKEV